MSATHILIALLGEIALLLWGIHMIHSGVLRAYGSGLRRILGRALKTRGQAFLAGLGVTTILQSSTATAMMAASFAAAGIVGLVPALAVMLGANVGTTLIVQVLSFDITAVFPILILAGVIAFRRARGQMRDIGRAAIGLGLVLVALHLMIETMEPVEAAPMLRNVLAAISGEPLLNLGLAAIFTWAAHSSVAAMLFIMQLAGAGVVTPEAAMAMVLGANLGSAINPVFEGTGGDPVKLRMPVGNLFNRLIGCVLVLPFLHPLTALATPLHMNAARLAADFHTVFNLALAALFIALLPGFARLLERLLPERPKPADQGAPVYLDTAAIETPAAALSNAAREALRMADVAETMLHRLRGMFASDDRRSLVAIRRMDDILDRLNHAIRLHLAAISREELGDDDNHRLTEVLAFATNCEHVGDTIEKSLIPLAMKRMKQKLSFSAEGLADIEAMQDRLIANLKLAGNVFVAGDIKLARRLVRGKEAFRALEAESTRRHFARMRAERTESLETTALHIDILRDLKQIEGFIAATVYPLLERSGELKTSRLAS